MASYFTILNYQGSKKKLICYMHDILSKYIDEGDTILDIFSGACSVSYSYKSNHIVYANDVEKYASIIAKALLGPGITKDTVDKKIFLDNYKQLCEEYRDILKCEEDRLSCKDADGLASLYKNFKTIWDMGYSGHIDKSTYRMFIQYYSTNYFGIKQAIEIDAIRKGIDYYTDDNIRCILFTSLFYAMKESVFSKDGHMAQPLDIERNKTKLLHQREKNIIDDFFKKLDEFSDEKFIVGYGTNYVYNCNFEELLLNDDIVNNVDIIYADPPYTDMQYSRYYHLLNTVVEYDYSNPTVLNGKYTKGLYLNNRLQSQLSQKSKCFESMKKLIKYSRKYNKTLIISFACPQYPDKQKTDRYVMKIDSLIHACIEEYTKKNVHIINIPYEHSNNRNSYTKKVLEYLIICERDKIYGSEY